MGTVFVDQNPVAVIGIVAIAGDVRPALDHQDLPTQPVCGPFRDGATGRTGSTDQQIDVV
jgi:hypothetical protein